MKIPLLAVLIALLVILLFGCGGGDPSPNDAVCDHDYEPEHTDEHDCWYGGDPPVVVIKHPQ